MKTIRMKKADWEKWDTALRSGEYKQSCSALKNESGYCCLGVLEHALDGCVEQVIAWPSEDWLAAHGISFANKYAEYGAVRDPWLHSLRGFASVLNDIGTPFAVLAGAIKDAVEFTDV